MKIVDSKFGGLKGLISQFNGRLRLGKDHPTNPSVYIDNIVEPPKDNNQMVSGSVRRDTTRDISHRDIASALGSTDSYPEIGSTDTPCRSMSRDCTFRSEPREILSGSRNNPELIPETFQRHSSSPSFDPQNSPGLPFSRSFSLFETTIKESMSDLSEMNPHRGDREEHWSPTISPQGSSEQSYNTRNGPYRDQPSFDHSNSRDHSNSSNYSNYRDHSNSRGGPSISSQLSGQSGPSSVLSRLNTSSSSERGSAHASSPISHTTKHTAHFIQPFVKKEEQVWVPGKFVADSVAAGGMAGRGKPGPTTATAARNGASAAAILSDRYKTNESLANAVGRSAPTRGRDVGGIVDRGSTKGYQDSHSYSPVRGEADLGNGLLTGKAMNIRERASDSSPVYATGNLGSRSVDDEMSSEDWADNRFRANQQALAQHQSSRQQTRQGTNPNSSHQQLSNPITVAPMAPVSRPSTSDSPQFLQQQQLQTPSHSQTLAGSQQRLSSQNPPRPLNHSNSSGGAPSLWSSSGSQSGSQSGSSGSQGHKRFNEYGIMSGGGTIGQRGDERGQGSLGLSKLGANLNHYGLEGSPGINGSQYGEGSGHC
jgi:hypothetical protein